MENEVKKPFLIGKIDCTSELSRNWLKLSQIGPKNQIYLELRNFFLFAFLCLVNRRRWRNRIRKEHSMQENHRKAWAS